MAIDASQSTRAALTPAVALYCGWLRSWCRAQLQPTSTCFALAQVQVLSRRTMEPDYGPNFSAVAPGQLPADGAGRSEQMEKSLMARMPPLIVDACIAKMSVFNFAPGDVIIERDTLGTSMVRPSQPPPRKIVTRAVYPSPSLTLLLARSRSLSF